jgi:hypothetical protein
VLAGLTAAVAGTLARRRRSRPAPPPTGHRVASSPAQPQRYTCECGREYRTSGAGRHRVYWPADARENEPVLGDACPECGAALPAEPEGAAA